MTALRGRLVLQTTGGERLAVAGERIRRARELIATETRAVSLLLDPLLLSGLSATEAAELVGISRQTVYDLRKLGIDDSGEIERRVLAYLAAGGAAPVAGLVERTRSDHGTVRAALEVLTESQLIEAAVMQYEGGSPEPWYRATPAGLAALEEWVWRSDERPRRWSVYVPMLPEDRAGLERVAIDVFGSERFAVLEPGTVHDQHLPELAFTVTAETFEDAREQARIRTTELYDAADIAGAWAIRAILPADAWQAEFGAG